MGEWIVKLRVTFLCLGLFLIGGVLGRYFFHAWRLPTLGSIDYAVLEGNSESLVGTTVFSGDDHPYGRKFDGVLLWEHDRRFQEACAKAGVSIRMAAFQTTLPDPLPGEEFNVGLAADLLAGTVIPAGKVFMMNSMLGPYNEERGFKKGPAYFGPQVIKVTGGGVCKIASTLYNVTTLAHLQVLERHPHSMQVPYVPPGQDATVSTGSKDFKFRNTTPGPVLIWADTRDNTLYMAFYGTVHPPEVSWRHQILHRQPFRTIVQYRHDLKHGEEKVIIPGADGLAVRSWLLLKEKGGQVVRKDLRTDYYKPLTQVVERGR